MRRYAFGSVVLVVAAGCSGRPPALSAEVARVRDGLDALAGGTGDWSKFAVTYDDLHGLHGGLKVTVRGTGKVEHEAVGEKVGEPREVTPDELRGLVELLRQQAAWEQRVPARTGVPDESTARLTITYGADSVTTWEWYNERDRLAVVLRTMTAVAWNAPPP